MTSRFTNERCVDAKRGVEGMRDCWSLEDGTVYQSTTEVEENPSLLIDLGVHSEQRDHPRFTRLLGDFAKHRLEVRNLENDQGVVLDLTPFADEGGVTVDMQGQWYKRPELAPSDTLVPGWIDIPDAVIEEERDCWSTPDGRECDSTSEAIREVAERYFDDGAMFADGRWESIPARAWVEAIR